MRLRLWRQHRQLALWISSGLSWIGGPMIGDGGGGEYVGDGVGIA